MVIIQDTLPVLDEIVEVYQIKQGIPWRSQMIKNNIHRKWAFLILKNCCHRGRSDVAKNWSIVAKHMHVYDVNPHTWRQ